MQDNTPENKRRREALEAMIAVFNVECAFMNRRNHQIPKFSVTEEKAKRDGQSFDQRASEFKQFLTGLAENPALTENQKTFVNDTIGKVPEVVLSRSRTEERDHYYHQASATPSFFCGPYNQKQIKYIDRGAGIASGGAAVQFGLLAIGVAVGVATGTLLLIACLALLLALTALALHIASCKAGTTENPNRTLRHA